MGGPGSQLCRGPGPRHISRAPERWGVTRNVKGCHHLAPALIAHTAWVRDCTGGWKGHSPRKFELNETAEREGLGPALWMRLHKQRGTGLSPDPWPPLSSRVEGTAKHGFQSWAGSIMLNSDGTREHKRGPKRASHVKGTPYWSTALPTFMLGLYVSKLIRNMGGGCGGYLPNEKREREREKEG